MLALLRQVTAFLHVGRVAAVACIGYGKGAQPVSSTTCACPFSLSNMSLSLPILAYLHTACSSDSILPCRHVCMFSDWPVLTAFLAVLLLVKFQSPAPPVFCSFSMDSTPSRHVLLFVFVKVQAHATTACAYEAPGESSPALPCNLLCSMFGTVVSRALCLMPCV